MGALLSVEGLCKSYPSFSLEDVTFEVKPGEIMGFIGRNGAGKTTTLKSIMNLVHYEKGEIYAFGTKMRDNELENKQKIGFSLSEVNYYPNKKIRQLVDVTRRFYRDFDEQKFNEACRLFDLNLDKKVEELSSGMKVKFSLAMALSHHAEFLILDEPTSGLDPVSRDEILDIFRRLVSNKDRAILFSTHITSDLDKCASDITYIHEGKIVYTGKKEDFVSSYFFVNDKTRDENLGPEYIYHKVFEDHIEGLIEADRRKYFDKPGIELRKPDLEEIMVYLERSEKEDESFDL